MNGKLVIVLALFCVAFLVESDALRLRIRGRRILRELKKPFCKTACSYVCTAATSGTAAPVCGLACNKICGKKRRSAEESQTDKVIFPLPTDFDEYDTDKDGFITIQEFANVVELDASRDDVKETFAFADSDGDGLISEIELLEAPWVFEEDTD